MTQRKLTAAQRRMVNNDDVAWLGWDSKNRPVVSAYYYAGFLQPQDPQRRNRESSLRTWALTQQGNTTDVSYPIVERV